ncbi:hypothetical protein XELAEV_18039605mg [Xenopus laevis]|uniref:Uncharacterized protein n=1 Tax=Xenopus laevis TaxID=8355 RepID=A0A974C837_XENLA|nr:hypothetical protein XELAEV_18039605mg [Xenopus laevis]
MPIHIPSTYIMKLQSFFNQFLWNNQKPRVAQMILQMPRGGELQRKLLLPKMVFYQYLQITHYLGSTNSIPLRKPTALESWLTNLAPMKGGISLWYKTIKQLIARQWKSTQIPTVQQIIKELDIHYQYEKMAALATYSVGKFYRNWEKWSSIRHINVS